MLKKISIIILSLALVSGMFPSSALGLTMEEIVPGGQVLGVKSESEAQAYVVIDRRSGEILLAKNSVLKWPPASLTKLVTAMVFLESKTSLEKSIAMTKQDEVGGQRLPTKAGVKYKARDLLHAALIASDNNAAHALARSAGLTETDFIALMNKKVKSLGAENTKFLESTGMNPQNYTTAMDFAKIVDAALAFPYLSLVAKKESYSFSALNNSKYKHTVKTTNKLLSDGQVSVIGGKTGFLEESLYNFATVIKDPLGNEFVIVVLGAPSPGKQFSQTRELVFQATAIKVFGAQNTAVLGVSTTSPSSTILNFNK